MADANGFSLLMVPYLLNIIVLVPACYHLVFGGGVAFLFQERVEESAGLRHLVASVWLALLLASIGGLFQPLFFLPILFLQIVYKLAWLFLHVIPIIRCCSLGAVPMGVTIVFLGTVLSYPPFIALALLT